MDTGETAVVLLGHGSRLAGANRSLEDMAARVAACLGLRRVAAAFLQMARPNLTDALEGCAATGARRIAVVPFFLFPGAHVREDIPAEVDRFRARHPGVEIAVAPALGDHPLLAEIAAERAREALK